MNYPTATDYWLDQATREARALADALEAERQAMIRAGLLAENETL